MILLCRWLVYLTAALALHIPSIWPAPQVPFSNLEIVDHDPKSQSSSEEFESWVAQQSNRSFEYILDNIGGISSKLKESEVLPGVVIASPLKSNPDYFYNWIRDSALTIRTLLYHMNDNVKDTAAIERLKPVVELYIEVNYKLQRTPNRSGDFDDMKRSGLGEPKFLVDGHSFDEDWGRPQSDGPGLRVSTILGYLFFLHRNKLEIDSPFLGNSTFIYFNIIKPDLEYIVANWKAKLFDLWEEVNSHHFFNALTQLKALQDGQRFAQLNRLDVSFAKKLQATFDDLQEYVTESGKFVRPTIPYIVNIPELYDKGERSGLDAATFLAALHAHNLEFGGTDNIPFDVDDSHILNAITAMVGDMKRRYPLNREYGKWRGNFGAALGRYPEDVYDGAGTSIGNPWFIATLSASEVLYKWIYKFTIRHADVVIDKLNIAFFKPHDPELREEAPDSDVRIVIPYNSVRYKQLLESIHKYADTFIAVVQNHVNTVDGTMLEQFDRQTGYMRGAENLTWSYSAFHNCVRWRTKAAKLIDSLHHD